VSGHVTHDLETARVKIPAGHPLARVPAIALSVGVVALLAAILLGRGDPRAFAFSWLVAFLFTLSIALGCLYFVLIHTAMQGGWGIVVRRLAENAMATIPAFAILLLGPRWFGTFTTLTMFAMNYAALYVVYFVRSNQFSKGHARS